MRSIRIDNLPDEMVRKLKFSAAVNHTTLDQEIIFCLKHVLSSESAQRKQSLVKFIPSTGKSKSFLEKI